MLGSRLLGEREPGSLTPAQIVAGHLAGLLIRLLYGVRFTDMSPFRAIRRDALDRLGMREETFGWNLEMQMRVAAAGAGARWRCRWGSAGERAGCRRCQAAWLGGAYAACVLLSTFVRLALDLRGQAR